MNEYEIATLAIRESALRATYWQVAVTAIVGAAQVAIVWYGIRAMDHASSERAMDRRQHAQAQERRHTETMAALDMQRRALETLIKRTAHASTD